MPPKQRIIEKDMHLPKKVLINIFLAFLLSLSLVTIFPTHQVIAASPQDVFYPSVKQMNEDKKNLKMQAKDKALITGQETSNYQLSTTIYNLTNLVGCTDMENCQPENTAMGNVAMFIGTIYQNPPASGLAYVKDVLANAGILAKPAYAQGLGFAGLSPLLPLWKITRNIAYSVLIVIMVAIGFMVIFRMKIDPKTVISVQAALPKIVVTLLLITFSYAIVGFLVDIMYLVMAIAISMIATGMDQAGRISEFQTYFMTANVLDLLGTVFGGGFSTLEDFFKASMGIFLGTSAASGVIIALITGTSLGLLGIGAIGLLFILILFLGLFFTFIRILLLLLNSYIQLLIALVLGPLQLLFEAIPGRSAFSQWILNVMANLVVFPTTVAVLMFGEYLTQLNTDTGGLFSPPLTGVPGKGAFPAFMGLGVIFLAPTLIATVKKAFHPKPVLPITAGTAFAPLTGGAQTAMGAASQFYYLQQMPVIGRFLGGKSGQQAGHGD